MSAAEPIETHRMSPGEAEHRIYLGLGSNIQPEANLPRAIRLLQELVQVDLVSHVWETQAVGSDGPNFLNAALTARTSLSEEGVKELVIGAVERRLGRQRSADKYAPRTIDIDLLIYDGRIVNPQIWTQAFAAVPLAELIPDLGHSTRGENLAQAASRLASAGFIQRRNEIDLEEA